MKHTKIILSILLISILTTGCQNNEDKDIIINDNKDDTEKVLTSTSVNISGVVVDGYISGATVCLDNNNNNRCDITEPSTLTNKQGKYSLSFDKRDNLAYANSNILSIGGFDETAQIDFKYKLKAPFINNVDNININPLMETISNKMENEGINYQEAKESVAMTFDINPEDINCDILSNTNSKAFETALKLQKFKETLGFLNNKEKKEVLNEMSYNINGEAGTVSSIINNISNSKLDNIKIEITKTIAAISIPNNSTYEEKANIQQRAEGRKKRLNSLVSAYTSSNTNSMVPTNNIDFNKFKEIYNIQENIGNLIKEKGQLIQNKLELLGLTDMIKKEEFYTLEYKDFLNINFSNINTLDDLKYEISTTNLKEEIKQMFNDIIENKRLENSN